MERCIETVRPVDIANLAPRIMMNLFDTLCNKWLSCSDDFPPQRFLQVSSHQSSSLNTRLGAFLVFTIDAKISTIRSAAATEVVSAIVSYGGDTSTTSAPTRVTPSRPLMNLFSSRVVHPPDSGVPVAGAMLGSRTTRRISYEFGRAVSRWRRSIPPSMSMERYVGVSPTTFLVFSMIPAIPISSISWASMMLKPTSLSIS